MESLTCKHCGCTEYSTAVRGVHTGAYCKQCGKWIKWLAHDGHNNKHKPGTQTAVHAAQNATPQVVKGTERMQLSLTKEGDLSVLLDGSVIPVHKVQSGAVAPVVVVSVGDKQLEIPLGGSLNVYVM